MARYHTGGNLPANFHLEKWNSFTHPALERLEIVAICFISIFHGTRTLNAKAQPGAKLYS